MAKSKKQSKKGQPPVQEKVVVKRKSGCFIALLLLIAVIALLIWLMSHFHIGFFGNDGGGDNKNSSQSESTDDLSPIDKSTQPSDHNSEKIIDITVSGSQYFYDDGKTEVQDFISEIKEMNGVVNVRVTDNNAYVEYMQELISALEENGIPYTEYPADSENE
ncbi:MAG: hypothetical protein IJ010_05285 [Ruminococcus sp.]|nr:hypothetical protein [Ruminococcus sp.]